MTRRAIYNFWRVSRSPKRDYVQEGERPVVSNFSAWTLKWATPARGGHELHFRVLFSAIFRAFPWGVSIRVETCGSERRQKCGLLWSKSVQSLYLFGSLPAFREDVKKCNHLPHDGSVRLDFMRGWLRLCESERLCETGVEHPHRKKSGQSPVLETLRNDRVACLRFRRAECHVDGFAQTLRG